MSNAVEEQLREAVAHLVAPEVAAAGLELEAVELSKRRRLLVIVDAEAGVDSDALADATRRISQSLDVSDLMGDAPYVLEVSTRGIDRPLTSPRHFRRNVDRLVEIERSTGETLEARIVAADESGVDVSTAGGPQRLEFADIARATVQVELNRKEF